MIYCSGFSLESGCLGVLFRKYGGALQNKTSQGHLKVLEYRALNQKNSVYVLDYQGESFLVATSQQGSPVLTPIRGENKSEQTLNLQDDGFKDEIRKAMNEPS
jgi:flagellar biogenesis protein FliO